MLSGKKDGSHSRENGAVRLGLGAGRRLKRCAACGGAAGRVLCFQGESGYLA